MKNMSLIEIATACKGVYRGVDSLKCKQVSGVTIDSRNVKDDYLFIPIKGARVDGHDFINQVMEQGALCTLSEQALPTAHFPYILVDSCEQALKDIAEHYRQALGIKVVGITGSVGKTSTKEMIASVLSQKYHVLKTAGNFNNEIGLPLTIFNLTEAHEIAVLEMGINHFGEMTRLSKIARPNIAVITNIGECHLEFLQDRNGVLKAKSEIFEYMTCDGTVILNGEDDKLTTIHEVHGEAPIFFGLTKENPIYADNIVNLGLAGTSCTIHLGQERHIPCTIPIPGHHMVLNALAGASVGLELGLNDEEIKAGIEALTPVSGRNNIIKTNHLTIIDDCYNANPVSMKASINVLETATTRKIAILGDMGELGDEAAQMHYDVGYYAGTKDLDILCCIGSICHNMKEGAFRATKESKGSMEIYYFQTKEQCVEQLADLICANDSILVKASHYMAFEEIVDTLKTLEF